MADREKVINDLSECVEHIHKHDYDQFPFIAKCKNTMTDAITLLKAQEGIISALKSDLNETLEVVSGRLNVVRCKDCRYGQKCVCGRTTFQCFKWNSGEFGILHESDWFCADGIAKDTDVPNK